MKEENSHEVFPFVVIEFTYVMLFLHGAGCIREQIREPVLAERTVKMLLDSQDYRYCFIVSRISHECAGDLFECT
jgi:hypothetical protein